MVPILNHDSNFVHADSQANAHHRDTFYGADLHLTLS